MAQGLAYAHARGLVHRDIKPANLLFDEEGRVRVADFGVARALAEAAYTEPAGAMVGTARYMSPESAEGKPVDGRADVYSLALVLYEALSGTVPFVTDTTLGTLAARVGSAPPAPRGARARSTTCWPGPPPPRPRPGSTPPASRPAWVRWPARCPLPSRCPCTRPSTSRWRRSTGSAPRRLGADPGPTMVAVAKSGPEPAPVGTRAGPGEVFDAEPGSASGQAMRGGDDGLVIATRRKSRRKLCWIIGAVVLRAGPGGGGAGRRCTTRSSRPPIRSRR